MNPEYTIDQFCRGIGGAAWRMNLTAFCEALGWRDDRYAEEKFQQFQELARLLGYFDNATLEAILRTQGALA